MASSTSRVCCRFSKDEHPLGSCFQRLSLENDEVKSAQVIYTNLKEAIPKGDLLSILFKEDLRIVEIALDQIFHENQDLTDSAKRVFHVFCKTFGLNHHEFLTVQEENLKLPLGQEKASLIAMLETIQTIQNKSEDEKGKNLIEICHLGYLASFGLVVRNMTEPAYFLRQGLEAAAEEGHVHIIKAILEIKTILKRTDLEINPPTIASSIEKAIQKNQMKAFECLFSRVAGLVHTSKISIFKTCLHQGSQLGLAQVVAKVIDERAITLAEKEKALKNLITTLKGMDEKEEITPEKKQPFLEVLGLFKRTQSSHRDIQRMICDYSGQVPLLMSEV